MKGCNLQQIWSGIPVTQKPKKHNTDLLIITITNI